MCFVQVALSCIDDHDGYDNDELDQAGDDKDEDKDDKDDVIWPGSKSWDDTRAGNDDAWLQSLLRYTLLS